jgi:hypothetical protein
MTGCIEKNEVLKTKQLEHSSFKLSNALFAKAPWLDKSVRNDELFEYCLQNVKRSKKDRLWLRVELCGKKIERIFKRKYINRQKQPRMKLPALIQNLIELDAIVANNFKLEPYSKDHSRGYTFCVRKKYYEDCIRRNAKKLVVIAPPSKKRNTKKTTFQADWKPSPQQIQALVGAGLLHEAKLLMNNKMRYHKDIHGCSQNAVQTLTREAQRIVYANYRNLDIEVCHATIVVNQLAKKHAELALNGDKCVPFKALNTLSLISVDRGSGCISDLGLHSQIAPMLSTVSNAVKALKQRCVELFGDDLGRSIASVQINHAIHSSSRNLSHEVMRNLPKDLRDELIALLKPADDLFKAWQATLGYSKGMRYTNPLGSTRTCTNLGHRTSSELQALTEMAVQDAAQWIRKRGAKVIAHMHDGLVVDGLSEEELQYLQQYVMYNHMVNLREKPI